MKISLAVVLLLVAGFMAYRSLRGDEVTAGRFMFVDVATGELFDMDMDDVVTIPARNPNSGERSLLPCVEREDGLFLVSRRYATALNKSLKDVNQYVDVNTLEVRRADGR